MTSFRLGSNREQYSKAFSLYRREVMAENFGKVMAGLLVVVLAIGVWLKIKPRLAVAEAAVTRFVPVRRPQGFFTSLLYAKHVIFHPIARVSGSKAREAGYYTCNTSHCKYSG